MSKGVVIVRVVDGECLITLEGDHTGTTVDLGVHPSIQFRDGSGLDAGDFSSDPDGCCPHGKQSDGSYRWEIE